MTIETREQDAKRLSWESAHGTVNATPNMLRDLFNCPTATNFEIYTFVQLCKAHKLNPFLGEAYLIKYQGSNPKAQLVIGKDVFSQRAEDNPNFDGIESGVIVRRDDKTEYLTGTFKLETDHLMGGWARVHRKDRSIPMEKSVSMAEYSTGKSMWGRKPATMIEKVAVVHALRAAFPKDFIGMYDSSEIEASLSETGQEESEQRNNDMVRRIPPTETDMAQIVDDRDTDAGDDQHDDVPSVPQAQAHPEGGVERVVEKMHLVSGYDDETCPIHGMPLGIDGGHEVFPGDNAEHLVPCGKEDAMKFMTQCLLSAIAHNYPEHEDAEQAGSQIYPLWNDLKTNAERAGFVLNVATRGAP